MKKVRCQPDNLSRHAMRISFLTAISWYCNSTHTTHTSWTNKLNCTQRSWVKLRLPQVWGRCQWYREVGPLKPCVPFNITTSLITASYFTTDHSLERIRLDIEKFLIELTQEVEWLKGRGKCEKYLRNKWLLDMAVWDEQDEKKFF